MARFYGKVGFARVEETRPGVWQEVITEKSYSGVIKKNFNRIESGDRINDDLNISNIFSIIADPYANDNAYAIRYIVWRGSKWSVKSIDIQPPRLELHLGGLYNGPTTNNTTKATQ